MPAAQPPPPRIAAAGRYAGDATVFLHAHPCPELLLVESGRLRVEVPDRGFAAEVAEGALLMLPARCDHRHVGSGPVATAWVLLGDRASGLDDAPRVLPLPAGDPAVAWFAIAVTLLAAGDRGGVEHLVAAVLERARASERRQAAARRLHPAVARAQRLIEADPARAWSLAALARGAGVGGPHLAALFRAQVGGTPLQYQTRIRLASAERLLADPYRTVESVAAELGMQANYFCRLFRRHRGVSPDAWRRVRAR